MVLLVLLVAAVAAVVVAATAPRWRRAVLRGAATVAGTLVALFLVGRAIAEFWVVDYAHPASYRHSWGGPSLAGVVAVHSGPGAAVLLAGGFWGYRRWARSKPRGGEVG